MRLAALLVFLAATASSGCADGHPASPSPIRPSAAPGTRLSLGPSDYHAPTVPAPDPAPNSTVTINIVGSSGTAAFAPNPLQASVGHAVIWTNNDATVHQIVLGDGTMVGTIGPGQSSAPLTVSAAAVTYRCTFHPSMTGTIQDPSAPPPTPDYNPLPDDGYGGYY